MDKNIDLKHLMNNMREMRENNTFFNELLSLNGSNQFDNIEDTDKTNDMSCCEETAEEDTYSDLSLGLISNGLSVSEIPPKLTPSLQMRHKISRRKNLFGFENNRQLFADKSNALDYNKPKTIPKPQMSDTYLNNSLGLSPVRKELVREGEPSLAVNNSFLSLTNIESHSKYIGLSSSDVSDIGTNELNRDFNGIQVNSFELNNKSFGFESQVFDQSFKSLSKCSDLELKAEEQAIGMNDTFRSPNSGFDSKSIDSYFKQHSEPLSSIETFGKSFEMKVERNDISVKSSETDYSLMDASFAPIGDDLSASDNTLRMAQKRIDQKNRKRKSDLKSNTSCSSLSSSFIPSVNSTFNSSEESFESKAVMKSKSAVTSGVGTLSTFGRTYSMPHSESSQSIGLMNANTLCLNQLLAVSPNVLSLRIGCFVSFKLNYLKIKNLSITSFKAMIKVKANVDTLNALLIKVPTEVIAIPAFFDGLLTDQLTITPLKSGSFTVVFEIYPSIEYLNLPISPMTVVCNIRSEEIVIKRAFYLSTSLRINFNLFEKSDELEEIDLCISNKHCFNDIPLKFTLEPNKCFIFEPMYRHPDSAIHTFRCPDSQTLLLVTKSKYQMRIPLRIQSNNVRNVDSRLTVSTDSDRSHVLAIFRLSATFWPKKELTESLLQCSDSSLTLIRGESKRIDFRNKSNDNLIRLKLDSICDNKSIKNVIIFSSSQLMIGPLEKVSIVLKVENSINVRNDSQNSVCIKYDSGLSKSMSVLIPIRII